MKSSSFGRSKYGKTFLLIVFLIISCTVLFAEGENLTLKIAVIGPGDELYFWWGHIALIIEDSIKGTSSFYDYGIFSFDNENFFFNFAIGRLLYSCGVTPTEWNIANYFYTNRDMKVYTLDLPPEKRMEVLNFAETNVLPENRDYLYHHFDDNCSTRIRDIIDLMTDGQFYEQYGKAPARFTFRQHVRRHTWFSPAADWALNFWMGQVIDKPIYMWDEMFLPSEVGKNIEDFWYTGADGIRRKLVTSEETVYSAKGRPVVLDVPRKQWPRELAFSLVLSAIFGSFFYLQYKKIRAGRILIGRILTGVSMSISGLVFGFAGLLLYFMNIFSDHTYTYQNFNMLFGTPLLLAAVPLGIYYAFTKNEQKRLFYEALLRLLWLLTALGVLVSMALNLLPAFYQQNLTDQMLVLPIALVFAFQPAGLRDVVHKYLQKKIA